MESSINNECCPPFNPTPWEDKEIRWDNKLFIKDHVTSLFHIPLNFPAVMKRSMKQIESAQAKCADLIVLSDETSLWGADLYISVDREIPGTEMATLSGTFLSKVFEGPFRNMRLWIEEMDKHVLAKGKRCRKLYFYYTTCPKCARIIGKNYVVLLAQV